MSTEVKSFPLEQQVTADGIKLPIYMDNHATTPVDPRVLQEMLPYFQERFGNAASRNHAFGWAGEEGVETARERIAGKLAPTRAVGAVRLFLAAESCRLSTTLPVAGSRRERSSTTSASVVKRR